MPLYKEVAQFDIIEGYTYDTMVQGIILEVYDIAGIDAKTRQRLNDAFQDVMRKVAPDIRTIEIAIYNERTVEI